MNKIDETKLRQLIRQEIRSLTEDDYYDEDKLFNGRGIRIHDQGVSIQTGTGKFETLGNKELKELVKKINASSKNKLRL